MERYAAGYWWEQKFIGSLLYCDYDVFEFLPYANDNISSFYSVFDCSSWMPLAPYRVLRVFSFVAFIDIGVD